MQEGARGYPRILEYQVIPGENNQGVRLVVNEVAVFGTALGGRDVAWGLGTGGSAVPAGGDWAGFVCAGGQARLLPAVVPRAMPPPELARWVPRWNKPVLPHAIRVEMAPLTRNRRGCSCRR